MNVRYSHFCSRFSVLSAPVSFGAPLQLLGHTSGGPCCALHCFWSSEPCHWTYFLPQWGRPHQAFTLFGWVGFIAWRLRRFFLRECRRDPRHFGDCRMCLRLEPPKKNGLVLHSLRLLGRMSQSSIS